MLKIDNLLEPKINIKISDQDFCLDGSFKNLKSLQQSYDLDVVQIIPEIFKVKSNQLALIIKELSETDLKIDQIEELMVAEYGWVFDELRLIVFEFLSVSVAPQKKRKQAQENAAKTIAKLMEIQKQYSDSLGENIENSV